MHRAALLLALCAAAASWVGTAHAAPDAAATRYACGAREWTFLFWPKGHGAIPSVQFREFKVPHLEAYTGADQAYPGANFRGYAGTDGGTNVSPACKKLKDQKALATLPAANPIRVTAAIHCTFPKAAWLQLEKVAGGGVRVQVKVIVPPNKLAVYAQIAPQGSNLAYSRQFCKKKAAPR